MRPRITETTLGRSRAKAIARAWPLLLLCAGAALAQNTAVVVLRWDEVQDASGYEVQIAKDAQCTAIVIDERTDTAGYRWKSFPTVTHYWRVRSLDSTGRPGPWSEVKQVGARVDAPAVVSPDDGATANCRPSCGFDVVLSPQPLVQSFVIEWHEGDATGKVKLSGTAGRIEIPSAGKVRWRAGGADLAGREVPFSAERTVEILSPAPVFEASEEERQVPLPATLHLAWSARQEDGSYLVEVTAPGRKAKTLSSKTAALDVPVESFGPWAVRVAAVKTRSEWSSYKEVRFSPPSPKLLSPEDRANVPSRGASRRVALSWEGSSAHYVVQVAKEGSFDEPLEQAVDAPSTELTLSLGTSFWRVIGVDDAGQRSAPSPSRSVEVVGVPALPAPNVLSPNDRQRILGGQVTLAWEPVPEARGYEIQWLSASPRQQLIKDTSFTVTASVGTASEGAQPFRVRAVDADGIPGDWSPARTFFIGPARTSKARLEVPIFALASGEEVTLPLRLLDEEGQPVEGAKVSVSADVGAAQLQSSEGHGYQLHYRAPEVEEDRTATVEISDRGFVQAERLQLRSSRRTFRLAAGLGLASNGGELGSPLLQAELSGRLPVLDGRLRVAGRVGRLAPWVSLPRAIVAHAEEWPLSLLAQFEQPFHGVALLGSVGPQLQYTSVGIADEYQRTWTLGAVASVGGVKKLGPGSVLLDLSLSTGRVNGELARFRSGLFTLTAGYAWEP